MASMKAFVRLLKTLTPDQRTAVMTMLVEQDDCDICATEQPWKDAFGDAWCETRNFLCGPENWDCPGFPVPCP